MALTKVGAEYQVVIPKTAREAAGLRVGDLLEATARPDGILLRTKVVGGHVQVKKRLAAAEEDFRSGRILGPFKSAGAALRAVRERANARRAH